MKLSNFANKLGVPVAVITVTAGGFLLAGTGAAYADGPRPGIGGTIVPGTPGVVHVQAGATGQGHANQKLCDAYATRLNQLAGDKQEASNNGNLYLALAYGDIMESVENNAMDAGCFIVY